MAAAAPLDFSRALSIPAHNRTGTIDDVEHIVILMQENRSFDHYFGTMRGVRGFADPRAVKLSTGRSVWHQPNGAGFLLPFRPDVEDLGQTFLPDPPHGWADTHAAWNAGQYDRWVPNKGVTTMTYHTRRDLPYQFALADAFTICDNYHCSLMGPTDPNRYHMWTGWVGNDGAAGGPVITNAEAGLRLVDLPRAPGAGRHLVEDLPGRRRGPGRGRVLGLDRGRVHRELRRQLPALLPPVPGRGARHAAGRPSEDGHEHPRTESRARSRCSTSSGKTCATADCRTCRGSSRPRRIANTRTGSPASARGTCRRSSTSSRATPTSGARWRLFITYDEEGGFFDHLVPPTPPQTRAQGLSTVEITNEIFPGDAGHASGPYGLGVRVPMLVVSPWSRGGWVNSQVFDHTSLIRFLEARFAHHHPDLVETNITPWRRAVAGDLTTAFDFKTPNASRRLVLPGTDHYKPEDLVRHDDEVPVPPAVGQLPGQERGVRPARAIPYTLHARGAVQPADGSFWIEMRNTGQAGAVFQVRSGNTAHVPRSYTVEPHKLLIDTWRIGAVGASGYDLSVYGPNGFFRGFKGTVSGNQRAEPGHPRVLRGRKQRHQAGHLESRIRTPSGSL